MFRARGTVCPTGDHTGGAIVGAGLRRPHRGVSACDPHCGVRWANWSGSAGAVPAVRRGAGGSLALKTVLKKVRPANLNTDKPQDRQMLGLRFLPYLLADGAPSALLRLGCGMGVGAKGRSIRIVARHPQITVLRPPLFFRDSAAKAYRRSWNRYQKVTSDHAGNFLHSNTEHPRQTYLFRDKERIYR